MNLIPQLQFVLAAAVVGGGELQANMGREVGVVDVAVAAAMVRLQFRRQPQPMLRVRLLALGAKPKRRAAPPTERAAMVHRHHRVRRRLRRLASPILLDPCGSFVSAAELSITSTCKHHMIGVRQQANRAFPSLCIAKVHSHTVYFVCIVSTTCWETLDW